MHVEIRAARPEEMPEFRRVVRYVFADDAENEIPPDMDPLQPEWTTCAFVDGRLEAVTGAFPMTMRWNGAPVRVAGVTAVGTYPEARRQGLLRRTMLQCLAEQRERGQSVAILWASMGAIYQRFGYGLASTHVRYEFDPRDVTLHRPVQPGGSVRLESKDEALDDLKRVYIEYATPRNLVLHRVAPMWQLRLREVKNKPKHIAIYRNAAGEPRGYVIYETKFEEAPFEPAPNQRLTVDDFVALDLDAYAGLWDYLRKHDLVRRVEMHVSEDDPAPALLLEPRALRRRVGDAIWMRVVDVEAALPHRPYGEAGALTLRVHDELCDWNDATFRLETEGGAAEVKRASGEPDLAMPARTLAMLASGHTSATQLARWGLLESRDDATLRLADRLFATAYRPYCPDGF
jgi:predicted acetyltransferase